MDFKEYKCPVCSVQFKDGDDVVVCPECGAPHHRECYEKENRCAFEDKHGEGFDFEQSVSSESAQDDSSSDTVICPRCKTENQKGMFYCGKCGFPLGAQPGNTQQSQTQNTRNTQAQGTPFGFGTQFASQFDPMAGVNPDEDMGDGVTAGEVSKYVRNNTPYFIRVFNNIRLFNNGRFNFCGFLFGGAYLMYRKMYKLGAIFSAIMILLTTAEVYISYSLLSSSVSQLFYGESTSSYGDILRGIANLNPSDQMMLMIMSLCTILTLVLRIIVGAFANRWYFSHCKAEIKKIKQDSENPQQQFETKGGVNIAIAVSVMAIMFAINELPTLMQLFK